jgi:uncharacterized protein
MDPLALIFPVLACLAICAAAAVFFLTRRHAERGWRELALATDGFAVRLREARIRPARSEEEPDLAWEGLRKFRVVKKVIEDTKEETASFYFAPIDGRRLPPFAPGAYLNIRVETPDGPESRSYSISGAFRKDYYRLSIKRVPEVTDKKSGKVYPKGVVSNFVHDHLHEGSVLDISAPQCCPDFGLSLEDSAPAVLFGGGVGITPMLCMWEEIVTRQPARPVWLFYGVRGGGELMDNAGDQSALAKITEQVSEYQRLWYCMSRVKEEKDDAGGSVLMGGESDMDRLLCEASRKLRATGAEPPIVYEPGRISVKNWIWTALTPQFRAEAHFYMCGPGPFMKALRTDLTAKGVPERRIHYEEFGAESHDAMSEVAETTCDVVFTKGGSSKTVAWEGWRRDLQRLGKANEIQIRGACGVGACGDCETPVLSGQVNHTRSPLPFQPTPGCCLPCVAVPHPDCSRLELQA